MSSTTELVSAMAGPAAPGAYGSKKRGGSVAHSEPADVLSGLGEGAKWPNSTPAFIGVEEEEEVAALAVGLLAWSGGRGRRRGARRRSGTRRRWPGTAVAAESTNARRRWRSGGVSA